MIKRSIQEIADFFGCTVAQDRGYGGRKGPVKLFDGELSEVVLFKSKGRFSGCEYGKLHQDLVKSEGQWHKSKRAPKTKEGYNV